MCWVFIQWAFVIVRLVDPFFHPSVSISSHTDHTDRKRLWSEIETAFPFCLHQARQKKRWYWPERRPSKCWSQEQGRGSWSISMYSVYQFRSRTVLVVRIAQLKSPMRLDTAGERNDCGKHEVLRCIRHNCSLRWHDNCIVIEVRIHTSRERMEWTPG